MPAICRACTAHRAPFWDVDCVSSRHVTLRISHVPARVVSYVATATVSVWCVFPYYLEKTQCWNCHHFTDCQARFCPTCHKIQPVYSEEEGGCNYFQLFGLYWLQFRLIHRHESYDINPTELESNFKNLQKMIHPDLFSNKSAVRLMCCCKV